MLKNPLMLRNWKVLNAYLFETLCLECVASWNTYFEWIRKYQGSLEEIRMRKTIGSIYYVLGWRRRCAGFAAFDQL